MITIEYVHAIDKNGIVSSVEFGPHLNIISGPSNCGKTMILKCIDYLLGGSKVPLPKNLPIERLEMRLHAPDGHILLSRNVGENEATIQGDSRLVKPGTYKTNQTKETYNYGQMLMGLFGVPIDAGPIKIFKTKQAQISTLSIRSLINTFIVKEQPIISSDCILAPEKTQITLLKSSILFQLYGKNYVTGKEKDSYWMREKKSLRSYVLQKKNELLSANDWLESQLYNGAEDTINENAKLEIDKLGSEYDKLENEYTSFFSECEKTAKETTELQNKLQEDEDLISKCKLLKEQYEADVKRINFTLKGRELQNEVREPEQCPFCGGKLSKEKEEDCAEASEQELADLLPKLKDLENEIKSLEKERSEISDKYQNILETKNKMDEFLNRDLKPRKQSIKKRIEEYGNMVKEAQEKGIIRQQYISTTGQLKQIEQEISEAVTEFDPDSHFEQFSVEMSSLLVDALTLCHFQDSGKAVFDIQSFDIKIGESTKGDYGKGYIAFLNSIVSFVLHQYLEEKAKYKGLPFIIDSPIMSLREVSKAAPDEAKEISEAREMKKPLFKYFLNHSRDSQTIVIENEVPDLDYGSDTKMIRYGKGSDSNLPYGFLNGIK